jgi:hypothetical protein
MSDRLYLSCWVRGFNEGNMLRYYGQLLDIFPFSKLSQQSQTLRVYAVDYAEPPAAEKPFDPGVITADILDAAKSFSGADCAIDFDTCWDLWQYDGKDWNVAPAGVTLTCLGPRFEPDLNDGLQDHLRIDFGLDSRFLPIPGVEGSLKMQQSNLRSLLHLVQQVEKKLPLSRRNLWSESGENFVDLLKQSLGEFPVN